MRRFLATTKRPAVASRARRRRVAAEDPGTAAPGYLAVGLIADLGADLVAVPDDFDSRRPDDSDFDLPDEFAAVDRDDPLDS